MFVIILIISIISNPLCQGLPCIIRTYLDYFNYFNSLGYEIIQIFEVFIYLDSEIITIIEIIK